MTTKRKKIFKAAIAIIIIGIVAGAATAYYMFNAPHRDVQKAKTDFSLTAQQIVMEYMTDAGIANEKYLANDGNSKIIEVSGTISKISEDFNGRKVVLLKENGQPAGVSCTFVEKAGPKTTALKTGQTVTIKGVIRSGANFIEDFGLWENVILEKCSLIN